MDPTSGRVNIQSSLRGSVATFSCDADHLLGGDATRTCTLDGWSGSNPTCGTTQLGYLYQIQWHVHNIMRHIIGTAVAVPDPGLL